MSIREKIAVITAKHAELQQEIRSLGESLLKEETATLFEKYPTLESISWNQYTPYFNDGDSCSFSAHTDYTDITIDGVEETWVWVGSNCVSPESVYEQVALDFRGITEHIPEEVFEDMFGDHVRVTITKDGITTDDYDHD
jgi:hypothetical protein